MTGGTWSDVRRALAAGMALASELPTKHVTWEDAASTGWTTEPVFSLRIISAVARHQRQVLDPATRLEGISELTEFVLSIRSESVATIRADKSGKEPGRLLAFDALHHVTMGERRRALWDFFRAAGIAWTGNNGIRFIPYESDGRRISCYQVDLFMRAEIFYTPRDGGVGTIEHVEIDGEIPDPPLPDIAVPLVVNRP